MARYTDPPMLTKKSTAKEDSADRETIKNPTHTRAGPVRHRPRQQRSIHARHQQQPH